MAAGWRTGKASLPATKTNLAAAFAAKPALDVAHTPMPAASRDNWCRSRAAARGPPALTVITVVCGWVRCQ
jgi:hypothetical protein